MPDCKAVLINIPQASIFCGRKVSEYFAAICNIYDQNFIPSYGFAEHEVVVLNEIRITENPVFQGFARFIINVSEQQV